MTAPKPRAAELVEVFLRMGKAGHYTTALLEDIVFAARAEAVAEERSRVWRLAALVVASRKATASAVGYNDAYRAALSDVETVMAAHEQRDLAGKPHGSDLMAARAEAVAPVLAVLRQLVAACHKCANCESPAMRKAANEALYCDAHGYYLSGTQMDDHRIAAPLRAALALLAEHKEGK